jgi:hypothetical protein
MSASSSRVLRLSLLTATLTAATVAQGPRLHAAIAASEHRGGTPAVAWLCEDFLPTLPSWPDGLDPHGPLALTFSAAGVTVGATEVEVPAGAVAIGTASFTAENGGPSLLWRCERDGREQWTVQPGFELPSRWHALLQALEADVLETPRSLAVPVLAGHLGGCMLEGDPRATLLRICPMMCGDATWLAWRDQGAVLVRGRSEGGLMLPLALLMMAVADGDAEPTALQLRAFAARDPDQHEAARQLGRADRELDVDTLRSLLLADDDVRLTAIDALIRRHAAGELPRIVDAAAPDLPWTTIAARDAVHELWPLAAADVRQRTRQALQRSRCTTLRAIDVDALDRPNAGEHAEPNPPHDPRGRALVILMCTAIGVLGLWSRERIRLQTRANGSGRQLSHTFWRQHG